MDMEMDARTFYREKVKAAGVTDDNTWTGSAHYHTGGVEPIDLYRSGGMFRHFALCSIIKYAFRNRDKIRERDMDKIIHYAKLLKQGGE